MTESTELSMKRAKRIQSDKQRDGVAACPVLRGSASRAYSPVRPLTLTGFTLVGPAGLNSGR